MASIKKPHGAGGHRGVSEKADYRGQPHYIDIAACLEDFRAYIQADYGLALLGDLRADGQFHGIGTDQDKRGAKPFRCCAHLDDLQNIYFQDLKRGFEGTWFPQGQAPLNPAEKEARWREAEARRAERERETTQRHAKAAARARALWHQASPPALPIPT